MATFSQAVCERHSTRQQSANHAVSLVGLLPDSRLALPSIRFSSVCAPGLEMQVTSLPSHYAISTDHQPRTVLGEQYQGDSLSLFDELSLHCPLDRLFDDTLLFAVLLDHIPKPSSDGSVV